MTPEIDVLDQLPAVFATTEHLMNDYGELDAAKIAQLFGLTHAEVMAVAGSTDPEALRPFARIARLLVLNPDQANFLRWLRYSNLEFNDHSPLDVIRAGKINIVGELVFDILTGNPG